MIKSCFCIHQNFVAIGLSAWILFFFSFIRAKSKGRRKGAVFHNVRLSRIFIVWKIYMNAFVCKNLHFKKHTIKKNIFILKNIRFCVRKNTAIIFTRATKFIFYIFILSWNSNFTLTDWCNVLNYQKKKKRNINLAMQTEKCERSHKLNHAKRPKQFHFPEVFCVLKLYA